MTASYHSILQSEPISLKAFTIAMYDYPNIFVVYTTVDGKLVRVLTTGQPAVFAQAYKRASQAGIFNLSHHEAMMMALEIVKEKLLTLIRSN